MNKNFTPSFPKPILITVRIIFYNNSTYRGEPDTFFKMLWKLSEEHPFPNLLGELISLDSPIPSSKTISFTSADVLKAQIRAHLPHSLWFWIHQAVGLECFETLNIVQGFSVVTSLWGHPSLTQNNLYTLFRNRQFLPTARKAIVLWIFNNLTAVCI